MVPHARLWLDPQWLNLGVFLSYDCLSVSDEPFSLFHHSGLIWFECFTVMIPCISWEACMRAIHFCVLTTAESSVKN